MGKFKIFILLQFLFFFSLPVLAQGVYEAWVTINGPGNADDFAEALAVDDSGNIYVTGTSGNFSYFNYATIKYDSNGDTLWVRRYSGLGNSWDQAFALAVDDSSNVYVTGFSEGSGTGYDYATIKYKPNGDTAWVRRYNGPGNFSSDAATALAVDNSGNIYVTGSSWDATADDYATIKYAPNGDAVWVRRYNGPGNDYDDATALAVDSSGNVYVTGGSVGVSGSDYATIKYAPNGDTLWVRRYNGPGNDYDNATALAVDAGGNVYVTGSSWGGTSDDYATIRYAPNGDTLWVRRYNGPGDSSDVASALAVDDSGNVYVTGYSFGSGSGSDYATIKYSPNGDTLWVRRYNGPGNSGDIAYALAADDSGNVYVTGTSYGSGTFSDYATIKYAPNGDTLWVRRYNGPGNDLDLGRALAVDASCNVYVTGFIWSGTSNDYATIKYVQCFAKAGDANASGGNPNLADIIYLVNFVFKEGPAPSSTCRGDADSDGNVIFPDIIYLVNYVFKGGPAPVKSGACCL